MSEAISARPKSLVYLGSFLLGAATVLAFAALSLSLAGSFIPDMMRIGHSMHYWGMMACILATAFGTAAYGVARSLDL